MEFNKNMQFDEYVEYLSQESEKTRKFLEYKNDYLKFIKDNWFALTSDGYKNITPYKFQEKLIKKIQSNSNLDIIAQARQLGISSLICAYIACYLIFNKNKNIILISNKLNSSNELLSKIRLVLKNYSINGLFKYEDDKIIDKIDHLSLKNGCQIRIVSATSESLYCNDLRNTYDIDKIDLCFIDNASHINNFNILIDAFIIKRLSKEKKIKFIINSSPRSESYFNKLILDSQDKLIPKSTFTYLPWNVNVNRNLSWFNKESFRLGERQEYIDQELNCIVNFEGRSSKDENLNIIIPFNVLERIKTKIGNDSSISDYIKCLINKDLGI